MQSKTAQDMPRRSKVLVSTYWISTSTRLRRAGSRSRESIEFVRFAGYCIGCSRLVGRGSGSLEWLGDRVRKRAVTTNWIVVAVAISAATAMVGGCSQVTEYQSAFPAVMAPPAPRAEQPMSADELKQATDALISDRTKLTADVQGAQQASAPATTGTTRSAGAATGQ
jgi:hypothetical protein